MARSRQPLHEKHGDSASGSGYQQRLHRVSLHTVGGMVAQVGRTVARLRGGLAGLVKSPVRKIFGLGGLV